MASQNPSHHHQTEGFLSHFQKHAFDSVRNAYAAEHSLYKSSDGAWTTSLAEDVFCLLEMQRAVLTSQDNERLLVEGMLFVLKCVQHEHQQRHQQRHQIFHSMEEACAAANDLLRMSQKMEDFVTHLNESVRINPTTFTTLGDELVQQLCRDAVQATERSLVFLLRTVQHDTNIPQQLFSVEWEEELTQNEVVQQLIDSVERYIEAVQCYLADSLLYQKAVWMAAQACICFYVRSLVDKADACRRRKAKPFSKRALLRMNDDIKLLSEYLQSKPVLSRRIRPDLDTLHLIRECLSAADTDSLESFVIVLHKRTGSDALVTRQLVTDLQWLVGRPKSGSEAFRQVQTDLQMVTRQVHQQQPPRKIQTTSQLVRLDAMLKTLYEDRLVQGVLPVCWLCLPDPPTPGPIQDDPKIARRLRKFTRNVTQFRMGGSGKKEAKSSPKTEERQPLNA